MLPPPRIVREATRSPALELVLLGLSHVDVSAKKRVVGALLDDCREMLRAIHEPASDTRPAVSPLFGRFLRERSD
jgi:hypothetical protein